MSGGDAGVWTPCRLAKHGQRRLVVVRVGCLLQAQGGSGIEEAIGEHADMQCARETGEHRAKPRAICNHDWKGAKFYRCSIKRLRYAWCRWSGKRRTSLPLIEVNQQVIKLPKRTLVLDLGAEAGPAGAGIALEGSDGGMLRLDHASDRAERTVGDMPCDRSAKLPCRDAPGLTIAAVGNSRLVDRAEQLIEVIAIKIELAHDLGREVILAHGFSPDFSQSSIECGGG